MPIIWTLKQWMMVNRNIYRANQLCEALKVRAGFKISIQAIHMLINKQPDALRLHNMQAICTALGCKLSDFCEVFPDERANGETVEPFCLQSPFGGSQVNATGALTIGGEEDSSLYLKGYKDGAMTILLRILGPNSPQKAVELLQAALYADRVDGEEVVAKFVEPIMSDSHAT